MQTSQWYQNLILQPEDAVAYCAPLVGQAVREAEQMLGSTGPVLQPRVVVLTAAAGKLPGLVTRAEAALDDYDADRRSPQRNTTRRMMVIAFWVLIAIAVTLVVRLFI